MTGVLVLLRHGESTANQAGIFSGLLDVPLTRHGTQQARAAGILLGEHGIFPDIAFTSTLQRAVRTAELVKSAVGKDYPTEPIWQLNERNYGALTGVTKTRARAELGEAEFSRLRRSLHGRPPAMSLRSWIALRRSPALRRLPAEAFQTCITSPPYFQHRDYGVEGQIGQGETPDDYLARLGDAFAEVRRTLRNDGTLWVTIGDSYVSNPSTSTPNPSARVVSTSK